MTHNDRVQQKFKITPGHYQPPPVDKHPEYARTIALLKEEVKRLQNDVSVLKNKVAAQEENE